MSNSRSTLHRIVYTTAVSCFNEILIHFKISVLVRNQQIIKDQIRETIDLGKTITSEEVLHNEKSPKSPSCGVLPNNKKYNLRSASKAVPNVSLVYIYKYTNIPHL